jgi:hypothetical protein
LFCISRKLSGAFAYRRSFCWSLVAIRAILSLWIPPRRLRPGTARHKFDFPTDGIETGPGVSHESTTMGKQSCRSDQQTTRKDCKRPLRQSPCQQLIAVSPAELPSRGLLRHFDPAVAV